SAASRDAAITSVSVAAGRALRNAVAASIRSTPAADSTMRIAPPEPSVGLRSDMVPQHQLLRNNDRDHRAVSPYRVERHHVTPGAGRYASMIVMKRPARVIPFRR